MKITEKNQWNLVNKEISGPETIVRASELLYEILNHSYQVSRNCLETEINGQRYSVQDLYWQCKEQLGTIEKGGEKTAFLSMSVLEDTFKKALPLLLVNVEEIADGNLRQAECVNELRKIFAENEYKEIWKEKAESYRNMIASLGLELEYSDYEDLTLIMEPLLDALTLFDGKEHRYPPTIYKVRGGAKGKQQPQVMTSVCKFSSEKEFADALAGCGKDSVIAFGAVEKTERQVRDGFYEYFNGCLEERMRNGMRNHNLSKEEYLDLVVESTKKIYLGVKSGETIWLMKMPYTTDFYHYLKTMEDRYYYGKRAGYAPYEIFFADHPAQPEGTTFLAVKQTGYKLNDLMDDQQKIWLPVFLQEVTERFFKKEPEEKVLYFPEEIYSTAGSHEIIPVSYNNLPMTKTLCYSIPGPEVFFADEPHTMRLIRHFNITIDDIKDAPILVQECMIKEEAEKNLEEKAKKAYRKVLAERVSEFLKDKRFELHKELKTRAAHEYPQIMERMKRGELDGFLEIKEDGKPLLNGDGSEKVYGRVKDDPVKICTDDYRDYKGKYWNEVICPLTNWYGERANKPGVILTLSPQNAEDFATLFGMSVDDLPDVLKLSEDLGAMWEQRRAYPDKYDQHYLGRVNDGHKIDSIFLPNLITLKIFMKKKTYKQLCKEREEYHAGREK